MTSKWVEIIAIETEGTQIHFLSDVLVAVESLDLKSPYWLVFTTALPVRTTNLF